MRLYSSVSAEETTDAQAFDLPKSTLTTVKPSKHRWSALLFGQKNPQQGQLCELLNSYAKNGVPKSKTIYSFEHSDYAPALRYLNNVHGSWKEFINVDNMNDREIQIQSAIWELVTTEADYIHALQTVTEVIIYFYYFPHSTVNVYVYVYGKSNLNVIAVCVAVPFLFGGVTGAKNSNRCRSKATIFEYS